MLARLERLEFAIPETFGPYVRRADLDTSSAFRAAVSAPSLPLGAAVEVDAIVALGS